MPLPRAEVTGLLAAAAASGWVGPGTERTWVVTEDPADAAGLVVGASGVNPADAGLMIWSCVADDGARTGGLLVANAGVSAGHEWSETQDDAAAVAAADALVAVLASEVEPYLLRALLRRTGDPEDLVVEVLHLLGLETRLHTLLVEGPPAVFTFEPAPGSVPSPLGGVRRPRWWRRRGFSSR